MAKENNTILPSAALFVIRYHSFYCTLIRNCENIFVSLKLLTMKKPVSLFEIDSAALHRSDAYKHLMNEEDVENLKWLRIFKYENILLHHHLESLELI